MKIKTNFGVMTVFAEDEENNGIYLYTEFEVQKK